MLKAHSSAGSYSLDVREPTKVTAGENRKVVSRDYTEGMANVLVSKSCSFFVPFRLRVRLSSARFILLEIRSEGYINKWIGFPGTFSLCDIYCTMFFFFFF